MIVPCGLASETSLRGVWGSFANTHGGASSDLLDQLHGRNSSFGWSNGVSGANAYARQEMRQIRSLVGDTRQLLDEWRSTKAYRVGSTAPARPPPATI